MATGSGLDAQLGFKLESTVGTAVTVDKFYEFNSESLAFQPTWIEPTGLRVGTKYKRASRLVQSRFDVSGSFELNHSTRLMGSLWKWLLGSTVTTPTQIASTTAYKQIHTPSGFTGVSATVQVGRPEPGSGTVRAHTFNGVKALGWEFSCGDNEIAKLSADTDAWNETTATALASSSFVSGAQEFNFAQATNFKLGGTASTASGETTIASGVAVATVIKKISIKGTTPMATDRYGLGNAGVKKEQLENDIPTITLSMDAEFDKATFYDVFKANTTTAFQLDFVGPQIQASGNNYLLSFIAPAIKIKNAPPQVGGPDIVRMQIDAEVYNDEVNPTFQVKLQSDDSTAL